MERFQHVPDEDVSSSGEADPKRQKSDNSGSTKRKRESKLKNVVVLLGDDVRKEDGKVYMLNRPETAQLKKPELGQLKSKIKFTETMTEKNVEEELRQHFPILRDNGRFSCASAADNRTRLEFHNSPGTVWNGSGTVWDGTKIKRLITGNAVLYVLSEVRRSVESNNSSDSAFESTTGNASGVDDNTEHSTVITLLCPKEGPIMGGTQFVICLNVKSIPENLTSLKATFKEVGVVDLTPVTAGVHSGCSPASKTLGKVAVTVGSPDGTWNSPEETEFEYYPGVTQEFQKLIAKMPDTKRNIPLDYQTLNPSRSAGTVCSPSSFSSVVDTSLMADESKDILSLKALKGILFAAAAANDRECIETIFSTSAGEAVFQTYRNSSILPENTARAMGHKDLAEYLQNIHKRLSKEIVCNVQTVTIDWVELKHATAKKDICSGTDESQGLELEGFLESDDDQTNYFADDETSICQSPSASEFEDECIESKCQNDLIQQLSKKHFTVAMVTGRSSIKMPCENEDLPEEENAPDFDEDTLRAIADVYRNEGNEAFKKGDFINAIHFYTKGIKMNCNEKELKAKLYNNRAMAHFKLGNPRDSLRDAEAAIELNPTFLKAIVRGAAACVELKRFEEAITWCDKGLAIDKNNRILSSLRLQSVSEVGDKSMEEKDPISLDHGCASSGDFKKVIGLYNWEEDIEDLNLHLGVYGNFGIAYRCLGDLKKAMEYHNLHRKIAKEVGDKHGEGGVYGNLGIAYQGLGELKKAIEYHNLHLKIAKEVGDKHREGSAYGNLGNAYVSLGEFKKAIEYHNLHLKIAKEVGDKSFEAMAYYSLGHVFELQGGLPKAVEYYEASINLFDSLRELLKSKDEWKVNFRNQHQMAYTGLWRVLVEQGNVDEALFVAEKGRAQALTDLMESSFCGGTSHHKGEDEDFTVLKNVPSNTVFQAVDKANVNLWVVSEGKQVRLRQSKLKGFVSENSGVSQSFESFMLGVYTQLGVRSNVRCENRSLDALREGRSKVDEKTKEANPQPHIQQDGCLSTLYDIVMKPVADLIEGDELLIIPDGPLWIAPYAALKDGNSKYLCESFTIRVAPSLASVRLIADCPDDYHKSSGALLVGDPWVSEVTNSEGEKVLEQLPCAKEEVEMIGKILNITPITGRQATKREVFKRLSSVSLVHFAAHGCPETGEIALTPDLDRISTVPTEKEDYILTIRDVLNVQLRAKLVVFSCCHSGRGEIKAEGVVGIARAFMGAGARSVVVSLWAIDDEATLQFMKCFYQHLAEGKPTSKSLNLAMKSLRESDEFHDIKYWAPFLLIGDDVTFDLMAKERENLNRKSNK